MEERKQTKSGERAGHSFGGKRHIQNYDTTGEKKRRTALTERALKKGKSIHPEAIFEKYSGLFERPLKGKSGPFFDSGSTGEGKGGKSDGRHQ